MELIQIITNANNRYDGDLIYYYKRVMKAPNVNAHYHNIRHMLHVLWEAYDGGVHMGLDHTQLRTLLIAALYHDFDHTGSKSDKGDVVNIQRAIAAIQRDILPDDLSLLDGVIELISDTQFPYQSEPKNISSMILRDADMSQTFSPVWIQSVLFGLGKELDMSYEAMLRMQLPFITNQKFYTSWGIGKFEPLKEDRIKVVTQMIELL